VSSDREAYRREYLADYGFERTLVRYRAAVVLEQIASVNPASVLEVGCGAEPLYARYLDAGNAPLCWVVAEPIPEFCAELERRALPGAVVVEGFVESRVAALGAALGGSADLIICSGVLAEVPETGPFLDAIRTLLSQSSLLHVNVANARSLHRRLAQAMGLIDRLDTLSGRNTRLQQQRVYDLDSLTQVLLAAGFEVRDTGGYFVKPFTHDQMEAVAPLLAEDVLDGLQALGRAEPDMASEIFVTAALARAR
jgi:hypothetical protein